MRQAAPTPLSLDHAPTIAALNEISLKLDLLLAALGNQSAAAQPAVAPADELLGLREVRALLGVSERTVRRMNAASELPKPTLLGRRPRWRRSVIDAWLARRG